MSLVATCKTYHFRQYAEAVVIWRVAIVGLVNSVISLAAGETIMDILISTC